MSLGKILGKAAETRFHEPDPTLLLPTCRIGVEFEFEGVPGRGILPEEEAWSRYWTRHEDNSLKDMGSEFVFIEPLYGKDATEAITKLVTYAQNAKWKSTLRTGLHIHLDVRDVETPQLVGMLLLYALYEPAIYRWVGDNRDNSIFCWPWYKAEESIVEAGRLVRAASVKEEGLARELLQNAAAGYGRYTGLNLASIGKFGSVEFRHMKTTFDLDRIRTWINLCMSFKAASQRIPTSDGAVIREVETQGPEAYGRYIFGNLFDTLYYDGLARDVMEHGVPSAWELLRRGFSTNIWEQRHFPEGENSGFRRFLGKVDANPFPQAQPIPPELGALVQEADEEQVRRIRLRYAPPPAPRFRRMPPPERQPDPQELPPPEPQWRQIAAGLRNAQVGNDRLFMNYFVQPPVVIGELENRRYELREGPNGPVFHDLGPAVPPPPPEEPGDLVQFGDPEPEEEPENDNDF